MNRERSNLTRALKRKSLALTKQHCKEFEETIKQGYKQALDHYFFVNHKGEVQHRRYGSVCFSSFSLGDKTSQDYHWFVFCHLSTYHQANVVPLSEKDKLDYQTWLMKHSPFAPAFVYKNPKVAITDSPIVLDCKYSPRYLMHSAVLCRYRIEHPRIVKMWNMFVSAGVKPTLALFLAQAYNVPRAVSYDKSKGFAWDDVFYNSNHIVFQMFDGFRVDHLKALMLGRFNNDKRVCDGYTSYRGMTELFDVKGLGHSAEIKFPRAKALIAESKGGWAGEGTKHMGFLWEDINTFLEQFLNLNGLKEIYDQA